MERGNPALLASLRESGHLANALAEIEAHADDLFVTEVLRVRKEHSPAAPTLTEQERTEAIALSGASLLVMETVIAPLGRPGETR